MKRNIAKYAPRNGDRAVRNFRNAVVEGRKTSTNVSGVGAKSTWVWPEKFVELFTHLPFHLQGELRVLHVPTSCERFPRGRFQTSTKHTEVLIHDWVGL